MIVRFGNMSASQFAAKMGFEFSESEADLIDRARKEKRLVIRDLPSVIEFYIPEENIMTSPEFGIFKKYSDKMTHTSVVHQEAPTINRKKGDRS